MPVNVSQRVLFAVWDTLAAGCRWLLDTDIPDARRGVACAWRDDRGGAIGIDSVAGRGHELASMMERMLACDAALGEAKTRLRQVLDRRLRLAPCGPSAARARSSRRR